MAGVAVREYRDADLLACRGLWAELTEHDRRSYDDPTIGGNDPGAYFDTYLATPERVMSWVAVAGDADGRGGGEVVGLTGLFDRGEEGEVEPVVVTERLRGGGVGRAL